MEVHFLGGADEIGASCVLVQAGGRRVLVDAGVRMGASDRDRLPDLARATDLGGLDAVVITHAHLDHSGAVPLVHGAFPRSAVFASQPTADLMRVLLLDAVKIMQEQVRREEEVPLYPLEAVESLMAALRPIRFMEPFQVCEGVTATLFPAGHVLGAAAVGLQAAGGRVLVTGDVSLTAQQTVPGMPVPAFRPDLVVCESTYGARLHASRRAEERRLADTVLDALRAGGKVLVPAFALGRAQEVLLILRRALAAEDAPAGVVWVDGMVRAVCEVYGRHPAYLAPALRRRAEAEREPFYTADGRVRPVRDPAEREAILAGPPCVVVSSSGMLAGGPSALYAARLATDTRALIAITGYQDEEAPGRRLQEAAAGRATELVLDGRRVPVACRVQTYGLSAHADAQELASMVQALAAPRVALVHGDLAARQGLARVLAGLTDEVVLPVAGDSLSVDARPAVRIRKTHGIGRERPLDDGTLAELHDHLWKRTGARRAYPVRELALVWYGDAGLPADLDPIHALLAANTSWFAQDPRRPFCYRPRDPAVRRATPPGPTRDADGRLEQNTALAEADRLLGPETGLYKRGAERDTWTIKLYFHFPDMARARQASAIVELAGTTGWAVELHPEVHLGALEQALRDALPMGTRLLKAPSVFTGERRVKAPVCPKPEGPAAAELAKAFCRATGFDLVLADQGGVTPPAKTVFDASGRVEINLAFAALDRAFADRPEGPSKKSKRSDENGELIELTFITPEVGRRHTELLSALERELCWRICLADRVDQQAVLRIAAELIPPAWALSKNPGLDVTNRKILIKPTAPPPTEELAEISAKLHDRTGFDLALR